MKESSKRLIIWLTFILILCFIFDSAMPLWLLILMSFDVYDI